MMRGEIIATSITREAIHDYGIILTREGDISQSTDSRPDTSLSIEIVRAPAGAEVVEVCKLERHPTSVQAFFPLGGAAYTVIVCRSTADDEPDLKDLKAFIVPGNFIVQYHAGIWHAPIRMAGQANILGMVVHKAGRSDDCEFVSVPPFKVKCPQEYSPTSPEECQVTSFCDSLK